MTLRYSSLLLREVLVTLQYSLAYGSPGLAVLKGGSPEEQSTMAGDRRTSGMPEACDAEG